MGDVQQVKSEMKKRLRHTLNLYVRENERYLQYEENS